MAVKQRQDQSVLTTAEAAKLFGRSASWVRDQINTGRLHTLHPAGRRPFLITEASAQILKARLSELETGAAKPKLHIIASGSGEARSAARPHDFLRLVSDNTPSRS
jgi:hypothetical protein